MSTRVKTLVSNAMAGDGTKLAMNMATSEKEFAKLNDKISKLIGITREVEDRKELKEIKDEITVATQEHANALRRVLGEPDNEVKTIEVPMLISIRKLLPKYRKPVFACSKEWNAY